MAFLSDDQIRRLHTAVLTAHLTENRRTLLGGVDAAFVASLPAAPDPSAQILSDLCLLNAAERLTDSSSPLKIWLENALTLVGQRVEVAVFFEALQATRYHDVTLRTSHYTEKKFTLSKKIMDDLGTLHFRSALNARKRRASWLCLGFVCLMSTALYACNTATYMGQVLQISDGAPVRDADVILSGTNCGCKTDDYGYFEIVCPRLLHLSLQRPRVSIRLPNNSFWCNDNDVVRSPGSTVVRLDISADSRSCRREIALAAKAAAVQPLSTSAASVIAMVPPRAISAASKAAAALPTSSAAAKSPVNTKTKARVSGSATPPRPFDSNILRMERE